MKPLTKQRLNIQYRTRLGKKKLKLLHMEETPKRINRSGSNRAICSCHMCKNPRRSKLSSGKDKLTMQEVRANLAWLDEFE